LYGSYLGIRIVEPWNGQPELELDNTGSNLIQRTVTDGPKCQNKGKDGKPPMGEEGE